MKQSAGTLLYRQSAQAVEVLLVHPSGNYNRRAAWSIPKGEIDKETDESPEQAARRETLEETGMFASELQPLGFADLTKSRKRIYCFTGAVAHDAQPFCASWEVDRAEFLPLAEAAKLIHADQKIFLERLARLLQVEI